MEMSLGKITATWRPITEENEVFDVINLLKIVGKMLLMIEEENIVDYSGIQVNTFRDDEGKISIKVDVNVMKFVEEEEEETDE
jgi:hypothetical protein